MATQLPPEKRANGWMHQDATWYGGRSQPMGSQPPPPQKGAEPPIFGQRLLRSNGCMDQDATFMEVGLGLRDVGLGLRDIFLDGDPAPLP